MGKWMLVWALAVAPAALWAQDEEGGEAAGEAIGSGVEEVAAAAGEAGDQAESGAKSKQVKGAAGDAVSADGSARIRELGAQGGNDLAKPTKEKPAPFDQLSAGAEGSADPDASGAEDGD